jgi:hypothetical protein
MGTEIADRQSRLEALQNEVENLKQSLNQAYTNMDIADGSLLAHGPRRNQ